MIESDKQLSIIRIEANLKAMTTINEPLLDENLGKLESARAWSPRVGKVGDAFDELGNGN